MAINKEQLRNSEQHRRVVDHYIGCLTLPQQTQVLLITDNLPPDGDIIPFDLIVRRAMTKSLDRELMNRGHRTGVLKMSPFMDSSDMLYAMTSTALFELEGMPKNGGDRSTTVVCLTDNLLHKSGIHAAVSEFSHFSQMRLASSMGFGIEDYQFMSRLDENKRRALKEQRDVFKKLFEKQPAGEMEIVTQDSHKHDLKLTVHYDIHKAPIISDLGLLGTEDTVKIPGMDFQYANIPGGEMFAAPYPFNRVEGRVRSHGYIFDIHHGFLVQISSDTESSASQLTAAQKDFINLIQHGKSIPVSQFGFGLLEAGSIHTQNKSSLARKNGGVYIGFGMPESETPERGIIHRTVGTLNHVDFVLDNATVEL